MYKYNTGHRLQGKRDAVSWGGVKAGAKDHQQGINQDSSLNRLDTDWVRRNRMYLGHGKIRVMLKKEYKRKTGGRMFLVD